MDGMELFSTDFILCPDWSQADVDKELANYYQRQKSIDSFLRGEESATVIGDMLAEANLNPMEWVDMVFENLEALGVSI